MAKTASSSGGRGDSGRSRATRSPIPPPSGQGERTSLRKFFRESWGELRKVQWPTRQAVAQATLVVFVVTIVFAVYLTALDYVMLRLVHQIDKLLT